MAKETAERSPTIITSTYLQQNYGLIIRQATVDQKHFIVTRDGYPTIAILPATKYRELVKSQKP